MLRLAFSLTSVGVNSIIQILLSNRNKFNVYRRRLGNILARMQSSTHLKLDVDIFADLRMVLLVIKRCTDDEWLFECKLTDMNCDVVRGVVRTACDLTRCSCVR